MARISPLALLEVASFTGSKQPVIGSEAQIAKRVSNEVARGSWLGACLEAIERLTPQVAPPFYNWTWLLVLLTAVAVSTLGPRAVDTLRGFEFRLHLAPTSRRSPTPSVADCSPTNARPANTDQSAELDLDNYVPRRA